jgi:hypothetical protein
MTGKIHCYQNASKTHAIYPSEAYNEMSPWAFNGDGFGEQWKQLTREPKAGGHPTLKLLKSEE